MLVLARKQNESIQIGDDVRVTILHIGRGRVQIGIEAPRDVQIRRTELPTAEDEWTAPPPQTLAPAAPTPRSTSTARPTPAAARPLRAVQGLEVVHGVEIVFV
jgi:carbon storage regulator